MNPWQLIDSVLMKIGTVFGMAGARRHIRHARKLAAMLRRRAEWRNIGCQFAKAQQDMDCAAEIEAACDYIEDQKGRG